MAVLLLIHHSNSHQTSSDKIYVASHSHFSHWPFSFFVAFCTALHSWWKLIGTRPTGMGIKCTWKSPKSLIFNDILFCDCDVKMTICMNLSTSRNCSGIVVNTNIGTYYHFNGLIINSYDHHHIKCQYFGHFLWVYGIRNTYSIVVFLNSRALTMKWNNFLNHFQELVVYQILLSSSNQFSSVHFSWIYAVAAAAW